MTTTWADVKHRAIKAFNGELPNADTEQQILDAFEQEPVAVLNALEAVTFAVRAGKARSGWAVWRSRVLTAASTKDVQVDVDERPRQLQLAEAWIRNAGGYIADEAELVDELFGDRGRLRRWPELRGRIVDLWREQRPTFEDAEREAEERQARNGASYRALREQSRTLREKLEAERDLVDDLRPDVEPQHDLAYYDTLELPEEAPA